MKRFSILREVDPRATWTDIDSGAVQNLIAMYAVGGEPSLPWHRGLEGVRWIRSYWEPGSSWGLCLYEGNSVEQVQDWNVKCHVPFVEVREIGERESPLGVEYESGFHADPSISNLIAVEVPAGGALEAPSEGTGVAPGNWVRSYLDAERGAALALYEVDPAQYVVVQQLESQGWKAHRVVEITPGDYAEWE